jgi:hypothetical protein
LHVLFALLADAARRAFRCVGDYAGHALLPKTCPPTFGAGCSGDADLAVFQRLWINPVAARPSRPSVLGRCSAESGQLAICRESGRRADSTRRGPSLIERDSVILKSGRFAGI